MLPPGRALPRGHAVDTAGYRSVRLLKAYRDHRAGDVILTTTAMAQRLIGLGVACDEAQPSSVRPDAVERSVAPVYAEVRS